MSTRLQTAGTFRGVIQETSVNTTKNGFPQWVPRLLATHKWVDTAEELEFFHQQGLLPDAVTPAWVDYTAYDESIVGYLALFGKNNQQFITEGPTKNTTANYDQLKAAVGWEGLSFDDLNDDTFLGQEILFRVDNEPYNGKDSWKVTWIDAKDASPARELRRLDSTALSNLNAKLIVSKPRPKPVSAPATKAPAVNPVAAPATAPAPAPKAQPAAKAAPAAKAKPALPKPQAPAPAPATAPAVAQDLPSQMSRDDAWNWVCDHKGNLDDDTIKEAWIAACGEVSEAGQDKAEDAFTPSDWARVARIVKQDNGLL